MSGAGMHSWTATLLWLVPLAAAIVVAVLPVDRRVGCTLAFGALAFLIGDLAVAAERFHSAGGVQFQQYHRWVSDIGLGYHVGLDGLSLVLCGLVAFVAMWCLAFGVWAGRSSRGYVALSLLLVSALMLLFSARDLILFYVGFEAMLVPLAFLMGIWGGERRIQATTRFLVYTLIGSLLMLISMITLGLRAGSFDLDKVGTSGSVWLFLAFMIAFAIKAPLYPFHGWVPAAYRESTPEVAAMLSGVVSKAGAYGMLRFALPLFPGPAASFQPVLLTVSLAGLLWCSLVAFRQPDSRGVIAYSSISQMSLITLGIFVFNDQGGTGATFQMINHGLLSSLLFLLAGWVELRFGSGLFERVGSLARGRPALASICIAAGIGTLAVPGSSLFASEFLVLLGAFREFWLVGTLASITIVLAAMYMLRWISGVLHDVPSGGELPTSADAGGIADLRWEAVWLVPLVAAVLALSAYPYFVTHRVDASVHTLTAPAAIEAAK
jgi:NADH-quinone oxidoreductase subunit M